LGLVKRIVFIVTCLSSFNYSRGLHPARSHPKQINLNASFG
jgi:hypothetical protein